MPRDNVDTVWNEGDITYIQGADTVAYDANEVIIMTDIRGNTRLLLGDSTISLGENGAKALANRLIANL